MINWLSKRLKSKTIWLTSIAPSVLAFMTMYSSEINSLLNGYYQYVFMFFAALSWRVRELTDSKLDEK